MPQVNSLPSNVSDSSKEESSLKLFLDEYTDCFIDSIPRDLPLSRREDDHKIELITGSSSPNKLPYRISLAQQEKIMAQVNELVEKERWYALVHLLLLTCVISAKEGWFIPSVCGLSCMKQEHYEESFFGSKDQGSL